VAYRLQLPGGSLIHPMFHVSQLKLFTPNHTPVFTKLPNTPLLDMTEVSPEKILERRLVKRCNEAITQVLVQWLGLPLPLQLRKIITFFMIGTLKQQPEDRLCLQGGSHVITQVMMVAQETKRE
jgi:hypothetical protein